MFSLLHRSGLRTTQQLANCLYTRGIHSTASSPQQHQQPPNNDDDKKPNKDDEDDSKISSLLAKAFLWMLTAYMLIATVSLLFPSSNQPEVNCMHLPVNSLSAHLAAITKLCRTKSIYDMG